jgi:L-threonylcarbamoyladenylate synthase
MNTLSITDAIQTLLHEGIVAIPTETVYGLAARADSILAIEKIYTAKQRPRDNPLICHFDSLAMIQTYVPHIPESAAILLRAFTPGPLSVLVSLPPDSPLLPATGGRDSVICRIPNHNLAREIITAVGVPLAAPSANTSGKVSPTTAQMVFEDIGNRIDGIVDGGPCMVGLESTIVDCRNESKVTILRPGSIGAIEIEQALQHTQTHTNPSTPFLVHEKPEQTSETTPGAKYRHYAPRTPIFSYDRKSIMNGQEAIAVIGTTEALEEERIPGHATPFSLGSRTHMSDVAQKFYATLTDIDHGHFTRAYIISTDWSEGSITTALKNRLEKVLNHE